MKLLVDPPKPNDNSSIFQVGDEELRERVRELVRWAEDHIRFCHGRQINDPSPKAFDTGGVFTATVQRQTLEFMLDLLRGEV